MNAKKTKIMDSVRLFQEVWTKLFGAIERNGKSLCILCGDSDLIACALYLKRQTAF